MKKFIKTCHKCNGMTLRYQGAGIEQIAHWAGKQFPSIPIVELTADQPKQSHGLDRGTICGRILH